MVFLDGIHLTSVSRDHQGYRLNDILGVLGERSTRLLASPPGRASSWLNSRNTRTAPAWHELTSIGTYPSRILASVDQYQHTGPSSMFTGISIPTLSGASIEQAMASAMRISGTARRIDIDPLLKASRHDKQPTLLTADCRDLSGRLPLLGTSSRHELRIHELPTRSPVTLIASGCVGPTHGF